MRRRKVHGVVAPPVDIPKISVADANSLLQHGGEHRLKIAGSTADGLKYFRRCRLLLQCLRKVSGALAEVVGALGQFVEQPRVLDGDDGLSGEVRDSSICCSEKGRTSRRFNMIAPIRSPSFSIGTERNVRTLPSSTAARAVGTLSR